ncbi:hypothetical protein RFI_26068, partial [Reticulomyxa filosa]
MTLIWTAYIHDRYGGCMYMNNAYRIVQFTPTLDIALLVHDKQFDAIAVKYLSSLWLRLCVCVDMTNVSGLVLISFFSLKKKRSHIIVRSFIVVYFSFLKLFVSVLSSCVIFLLFFFFGKLKKKKMREVLTIEVGQAGIQLGNAICEQYCAEHGIDNDVKRKESSGKDDSFKVFFEETGSGQFVPRNLAVDLEPNVIDDVKNGPFAAIFHTEFLVHVKEDA